MFTVTFSAGAIFSLGLGLGAIIGIVGFCIVALITTKKKHK